MTKHERAELNRCASLLKSVAHTIEWSIENGEASKDADVLLGLVKDDAESVAKRLEALTKQGDEG